MTPLVDSDIGDAQYEAADVDKALHVGSDITLPLNKTEESHGIILHHLFSILNKNIVHGFAVF